MKIVRTIKENRTQAGPLEEDVQVASVPLSEADEL